MLRRIVLALTADLALLAGLIACAPVVTEPPSGFTETPSGFPGLDAAAQARRYRAMQQALEHNVSGQVTRWAETQRVGGGVVPIETVRTSLYGWCRDYEERIATSVGNHHLVGIACRTSDAQWLVVDIRSYKVVPSHNSGEGASNWSDITPYDPGLSETGRLGG